MNLMVAEKALYKAKVLHSGHREELLTVICFHLAISQIFGGADM